jgi:hypothetical protein
VRRARVGVALDKISRVLIENDGKLRPIVRALIYSALAFRLFSADEFLGPPLEHLATALHATGLSPGYHAAFDYMQLFVIGTRNGNVEPVNHLLSTSFQGPDWVTGGVLGTEASFLMYPSIVLMFVYIGWRRFNRQPGDPVRSSFAIRGR